MLPGMALCLVFIAAFSHIFISATPLFVISLNHTLPLVHTHTLIIHSNSKTLKLGVVKSHTVVLVLSLISADPWTGHVTRCCVVVYVLASQCLSQSFPYLSSVGAKTTRFRVSVSIAIS